MRRILPVSFIITFLGFLDTHMLIPVIAVYASGLGATVGMVGLIVGLYSVTNTLANVIAGRVIDRYGRRGPLIAGLLGDALSMIAYSLCTVPFHLLLVRGFHGASGGLVGPATMSLMTDHAPKAQRGRFMGFYGISLALALLVGYALSGIVVVRLGYAPLFYMGTVALLLGVFLAFTVPKAKNGAAVRKGTTLSAGAKKVLDLVKRRHLTASYYSIFAQYFAFGGVVALFPLYVKGLGMTAAHTGILLTTFVIVFILFQFPSGALSDRLGRRIPAAVGLLLASVALCVVPAASTFSVLASIMALYGAGYALLFPSISGLVADWATPEEYGTATGLFHAFLTGGVALGAPLMGGIAGLIGIERALALSATATVLGIPVVLALVREHRKQP